MWEREKRAVVVEACKDTKSQQDQVTFASENLCGLNTQRPVRCSDFIIPCTGRNALCAHPLYQTYIVKHSFQKAVILRGQDVIRFGKALRIRWLMLGDRWVVFLNRDYIL